jgi:ubiquinone/menaquinone biosynthesis C-methylase UbiE
VARGASDSVADAMRVLVKTLLGALAVWLGLRAFAALRPTAFPYFARAILDVPRPLLTRRGLLRILQPEPGERMLEVGPGTGYYTLAVASRLKPDGVVEILDVRRPFLDHTLARVHRHGLVNVVATLGDGGCLPFTGARFDAAYLVTVLGEIPEPEAALRELRRVLKPSGRLIVGEIFLDPDFPSLSRLVAQARGAGFRFVERTGSQFAYFARFTPEASRAVP